MEAQNLRIELQANMTEIREVDIKTFDRMFNSHSPDTSALQSEFGFREYLRRDDGIRFVTGKPDRPLLSVGPAI